MRIGRITFSCFRHPRDTEKPFFHINRASWWNDGKKYLSATTIYIGGVAFYFNRIIKRR